MQLFERSDSFNLLSSSFAYLESYTHKSMRSPKILLLKEQLLSVGTIIFYNLYRYPLMVLRLVMQLCCFYLIALSKNLMFCCKFLVSSCPIFLRLLTVCSIYSICSLSVFAIFLYFAVFQFARMFSCVRYLFFSSLRRLSRSYLFISLCIVSILRSFWYSLERILSISC